MKLALIGAGQRGMIYSTYAHDKKACTISAVVDPNEERRLSAQKILDVPDSGLFTNTDDFFKAGKLADALIIASMDKMHYEHAMQALDAGYDLLLEKPISPNPVECYEIAQKAEKLHKKVVVCHVLRYTTFFSTIKQILDSGELGKIISIQHNENVGNFHIAHSFVRGNWRNSDETSPIIMQKSCHDLDILVWLTGSNAKRIASFGARSFFREENAPEGSAAYCCNCKAKKSCQYDAEKAYLPVRGDWPAVMVCKDQSEAGLKEALKTSPYGRCVFHCDNNVCDNQETIIEFENGVRAAFTLSGFTNKMCRTLKIMCEKGEIRAEDFSNTIEVTHFASNSVDAFNQKTYHPAIVDGFHGGGDSLLVDDFISQLEQKNSESRSSVKTSIESHIMAYAAEKARLTNQVIDISELKDSLSRGQL